MFVINISGNFQRNKVFQPRFLTSGRRISLIYISIYIRVDIYRRVSSSEVTYISILDTRHVPASCLPASCSSAMSEVRAQLAQARADGLINVTEYLDELRKCHTKQSAGASVAPADCRDDDESQPAAESQPQHAQPDDDYDGDDFDFGYDPDSAPLRSRSRSRSRSPSGSRNRSRNRSHSHSRSRSRSRSRNNYAQNRCIVISNTVILYFY